MSTFPQHARVVVIGAGIVGNSMAYHLARLGWKDIVLLDKGSAAQSRRLNRACVEFHFSRRSFQGDDPLHAG